MAACDAQLSDSVWAAKDLVTLRAGSITCVSPALPFLWAGPTETHDAPVTLLLDNVKLQTRITARSMTSVAKLIATLGQATSWMEGYDQHASSLRQLEWVAIRTEEVQQKVADWQRLQEQLKSRRVNVAKEVRSRLALKGRETHLSAASNAKFVDLLRANDHVRDCIEDYTTSFLARADEEESQHKHVKRYLSTAWHRILILNQDVEALKGGPPVELRSCNQETIP